TGSTSFSIGPNGSCTNGATPSCTATVAGAHTAAGPFSGKSDSASLQVNAAALDHIKISPASATILAGGSQAYTAEALDQHNNSRSDVRAEERLVGKESGSCMATDSWMSMASTYSMTCTFSA